MIGEGLNFWSGVVSVRTGGRVELVDLTERIEESVRRSAISDGLVSVQTLHTTTGILVNENEPLLLQDLEELFERWVPRAMSFRHDDLDRRAAGLPANEPRNGDAHARASLLRASETLHRVSGRIHLGRWQRIFLVELDGLRDRSVSVVVMGV
jgi:secondary thiamine-phosphate synthase enzyme